MKIKINGIASREEAELAISAKIDFIGMSFSSKSSHQISVEEACKILKDLDTKSSQFFGAFGDESLQEIEDITQKLKLKWIELKAPRDIKSLSPLEDLNLFLSVDVDEHGSYPFIGYGLKNGYWLYKGVQAKIKTNFARLESDPFFIEANLNLEELNLAHKNYHPDGLEITLTPPFNLASEKQIEQIVELVKKAHQN